MGQPSTDRVEASCLAFLAMFFARSHRTLYRAQCIGDLGAELGFSGAQVGEFARELQRLGYLRMVSALPPGGPLMQITPEGIRAVRTSYPPVQMPGAAGEAARG